MGPLGSRATLFLDLFCLKYEDLIPSDDALIAHSKHSTKAKDSPMDQKSSTASVHLVYYEHPLSLCAISYSD